MTFHTKRDKLVFGMLKPNCSHIAERNMNLQGLRTFLSVEHCTKRVRSKFITAPRPIFAGDTFIWRTINSTNGVTRLVSFGKEPAPVPLDIVSQLMQRCEAS